MAIIVIIIF